MTGEDFTTGNLDARGTVEFFGRIGHVLQACTSLGIIDTIFSLEVPYASVDMRYPA